MSSEKDEFAYSDVKEIVLWSYNDWREVKRIAVFFQFCGKQLYYYSRLIAGIVLLNEDVPNREEKKKDIINESKLEPKQLCSQQQQRYYFEIRTPPLLAERDCWSFKEREERR